MARWEWLLAAGRASFSIRSALATMCLGSALHLPCALDSSASDPESGPTPAIKPEPAPYSILHLTCTLNHHERARLVTASLGVSPYDWAFYDAQLVEPDKLAVPSERKTFIANAIELIVDNLPTLMLTHGHSQLLFWCQLVYYAVTLKPILTEEYGRSGIPLKLAGGVTAEREATEREAFANSCTYKHINDLRECDAFKVSGNLLVKTHPLTIAQANAELVKEALFYAMAYVRFSLAKRAEAEHRKVGKQLGLSAFVYGARMNIRTTTWMFPWM